MWGARYEPYIELAANPESDHLGTEEAVTITVAVTRPLENVTVSPSGYMNFQM